MIFDMGKFCRICAILQIGKVEQQMMMSGAVLEGEVDQILLPQGYPISWITNVRFLK